MLFQLFQGKTVKKWFAYKKIKGKDSTKSLQIFNANILYFATRALFVKQFCLGLCLFKLYRSDKVVLIQVKKKIGRVMVEVK